MLETCQVCRRTQPILRVLIVFVSFRADKMDWPAQHNLGHGVAKQRF